MTVNIYAFSDEADPGLSAQIASLKANCLDGMEIRNVDGESISDITPAKARDIKSRLDAEGLSVWSIGSPIGKIDIERDNFHAHLETFKRTLDIADILGAQAFRLFSFYLPQGKAPSDYREEVLERMGKFVDSAKGHPFTLCHENEKGIYGDTAPRCLEILTALPEIKGIFDPANFIQCGQDTKEAWELLKSHILYLHIKDALADGSVVPAGKGIGNLPHIVKEYLSMGGKSFTIEPHLKVFSGLAALEKEGSRTLPGIYEYESNRAAFDAACTAFREVLSACGQG